eukprot:Gb_40258 [translate_table: standard]
MARHEALHLLLVFLLMAIWASVDMKFWFTAVQGSQETHMVELRYGNGSTEEANSDQGQYGTKKDVEFIPVPQIQYRTWEGHGRRKLAPFQLCSGCTCCASDNNKNVCTTSACCYSITCGLPDKPYGVCAFTPKACNCTSCGI